MSMRVESWSTWKKRTKAPRYRLKDTTLGSVETIGPTLRYAGFTAMSEERNPSMTPKHNALQLLADYEIEPSEVVYNVWRHNQGYLERIEVYYK